MRRDARGRNEPLALADNRRTSLPREGAAKTRNRDATSWDTREPRRQTPFKSRSLHSPGLLFELQSAFARYARCSMQPQLLEMTSRETERQPPGGGVSASVCGNKSRPRSERWMGRRRKKGKGTGFSRSAPSFLSLTGFPRSAPPTHSPSRLRFFLRLSLL